MNKPRYFKSRFGDKNMYIINYHTLNSVMYDKDFEKSDYSIHNISTRIRERYTEMKSISEIAKFLLSL